MSLIGGDDGCFRRSSGFGVYCTEDAVRVGEVAIVGGRSRGLGPDWDPCNCQDDCLWEPSVSLLCPVAR